MIGIHRWRSRRRSTEAAARARGIADPPPHSRATPEPVPGDNAPTRRMVRDSRLRTGPYVAAKQARQEFLYDRGYLPDVLVRFRPATPGRHRG